MLVTESTFAKKLLNPICQLEDAEDLSNGGEEEGGLRSEQWGASEIGINPHSCVSISKFELSKKGG